VLFQLLSEIKAVMDSVAKVKREKHQEVIVRGNFLKVTKQFKGLVKIYFMTNF